MKVITLELAYWESLHIDSPVAQKTIIQLYISSFLFTNELLRNHQSLSKVSYITRYVIYQDTNHTNNSNMMQYIICFISTCIMYR